MTKEVLENGPKQPNIDELRQFYETHKDFAYKEAALRRLKEEKRTKNRTESIFSKEKLRTFMKSPNKNYKNIRNLSRFLYLRSMVYRRLIHFNANMIDLNFHSIIPDIDLNKKIDKTKIKKSYIETSRYVSKMNLPLEFLKAYTICWREDIFYGVAYADDDGKFFILPLDPDYCQTIGFYADGSLAFSYDFSYFSNAEYLVDFWGEPFVSLYKEYKKDTNNNQWLEIPPEYGVCLKVNIDDWEIPLPPYMNIFNELINLEDLKEISAVADEEQIYKLLALKVPLLKGSNKQNDFGVSDDIFTLYYDALEEVLPDYAEAALLPGLETEVVSFDRDQASDVNIVERSTKAVLNTSGGAQILNSASVSNSVAWNGAIKSDEDYALSSLLPQTQAWINRFLSYRLKTPCLVKFLETTKYTKDAFKESVRQDATYGVPTKFLINTLNGFTPYETLVMNMVEEDIFDLSEEFIPLQNSHTQSSGEVGRPSLPDDQISGEGEATRDKQ